MYHRVPVDLRLIFSLKENIINDWIEQLVHFVRHESPGEARGGGQTIAQHVLNGRRGSGGWSSPADINGLARALTPHSQVCHSELGPAAGPPSSVTPGTVILNQRLY